MSKDGTVPKDGWVEFLPSVPLFHADGVNYAPLGGRQLLKEDGTFALMLTRTDQTRVQYIASGACGEYIFSLNGPGPHQLGVLLKDKDTIKVTSRRPGSRG